MAATHAAPTPVGEQDSISDLGKSRKGKGKVKFLVHNLLSRTTQAINNATRSFHKKVGVTRSLEGGGLHGGESSQDVAGSTEGYLKDDDRSDFEGTGENRASCVLPERDDRSIAYLHGELSKSKQRNKELTEEIAQLQENLVCKGQQEKELTRQSTALTAELLQCKKQIDASFGVEIHLRQKLFLTVWERKFRDSKSDVLAKKVSKLEQLLEDERRGNECKICFLRPSNVVIYPCLHAQYCSQCVQKLLSTSRVCPSCRADIGCFLPTL